VQFLRGVDSVRDGKLVGLSILPGDNEWDPILQLTFSVPHGTQGDVYILTLSGSVKFDYQFSSEYSLNEIAFAKCLMTSDGEFYISLDPWKEDENFISEQDNDWFKSHSVRLEVERANAAG
jgi:hypothetical protein